MLVRSERRRSWSQLVVVPRKRQSFEILWIVLSCASNGILHGDLCGHSTSCCCLSRIDCFMDVKLEEVVEDSRHSTETPSSWLDMWSYLWRNERSWACWVVRPSGMQQVAAEH